MISEIMSRVIRAAHISEKATGIKNEYPQFVFEVAPRATKPQIKEAVEKMFNVKVHSVGICNVKGKKARFGYIQGRKKDWKKAYIMLEKGQEIELAAIKS